MALELLSIVVIRKAVDSRLQFSKTVTAEVLFIHSLDILT